MPVYSVQQSGPIRDSISRGGPVPASSLSQIWVCAGYLANTSVGAVLYNLLPTKTPPILLLCTALACDDKAVAGFALYWLTHIGMDRMLGYGLKYRSQFRSYTPRKLGFIWQEGWEDERISVACQFLKRIESNGQSRLTKH